MKQVGIGTRVLNFLVDTLLIFLLSYFAYRGVSFYAFYYHTEGYPWYYFFWATMVVYYFIFELIFTRTPGKWMSISKVVNLQGKRPASWQILVRSIVRVIPIDAFFIPFLDKTLHDYISKTAVVEA
jgi:uncharacterized RDD family membrane protein YckC